MEGRNLILPLALSEAELEGILNACCERSVYAHRETLREGYVTFHGCRVGVAGRAVMEEGIVVGIDRISSLVFRVPHHIEGCASEAVSAWKAMGGEEGLLVYSAPGVGKTTLLRDMALQLSSGVHAKRVAMVDCRGELSTDAFGAHCLLDILSGYPKAEGIEIATRTLSPEVVICDEIGGFDEAESILSVQHCGVPLIASAHGASIEALMRRSSIRMLIECGIFGAFLGIKRTAGHYTYTINYKNDLPIFTQASLS